MTRLMSLVVVLAIVQGVGADGEAGDAEEKNDGLHPRVKMKTTLGDIILELDAEKAPITVQNFMRYAEEGYYNGTVFHRVMSDFMIQGGGFTPEIDKKESGLRAPIKNEWRNGLKNERGTIAMARAPAPDSATSQFFINVVDNVRGAKHDLDTPRGPAAYCVFGKVVEGMETVDKIRDTKVERHPKYQSPKPVTPVEPVVIESVTLLNTYDREAVAQRITKAKEEEAKAKVVAQTAKESQLQELIQSIEKETGKKLSKTDSGLMYVILKEGDGASPVDTDRVKVHYTGWLVDGTKFDSSVDRGKPYVTGLRQVISGWTEGVSLMKIGEKRKFVIPPHLAYKAPGRPPTIPPNATLVFEIELLGIE